MKKSFSSYGAFEDLLNKIIGDDVAELTEEEIQQVKNHIIEKFEYKIDNVSFYLCTFKNVDYTTSLTLSIDDKDFISDFYKKSSKDALEAHAYFEKLKKEITTNDLKTIINNKLPELNEIENQIKNEIKNYE